MYRMRSGDHFQNSVVSSLVQSLHVFQISRKSPQLFELSCCEETDRQTAVKTVLRLKTGLHHIYWLEFLACRANAVCNVVGL